MPKGMQGFQPGRRKTGGRTKGEPTKAQLTNAFKDRLKKHGFDFDKELAKALKLLCQGKPANQYPELKALLPFTYPKLKEIEPPELDTPASELPSAISTADLLEALKPNGTKTEIDIRPKILSEEQGKVQESVGQILSEKQIKDQEVQEELLLRESRVQREEE
jgi:hypothetical protein